MALYHLLIGFRREYISLKQYFIIVLLKKGELYFSSARISVHNVVILLKILYSLIANP